IEWVNGLQTIHVQLKKCVVDAGHKYHKTLPRCPWCEIERSGGPAFFLTVVAHTQANVGAFDFQHAWVAISNAALPTVAAISRAASPPAVTAAAVPASFRVRRVLGNVF